MKRLVAVSFIWVCFAFQGASDLLQFANDPLAVTFRASASKLVNAPPSDPNHEFYVFLDELPANLDKLLKTKDLGVLPDSCPGT